MDWYAEQALERHKERVREIERYAFIQHARAVVRKETPLDKALLVLGRWLVGVGKRLQARRAVEADLTGVYNAPSMLAR